MWDVPNGKKLAIHVEVDDVNHSHKMTPVLINEWDILNSYPEKFISVWNLTQDKSDMIQMKFLVFSR